MTGWTKVLLATCGLGMLVTMAAWPLAAQEGEREREVREQKRSEDREAAERVEEREGRERGGAERRERAEAEERERGGDRERAGRERDGREREGRGRRISDGQRVENAVGELRKRLEQLKAQGRELANTDKEDAKHEVARAIEQTQERIEGLIRGFRARQAEREGREGEGRRPSREREREHERERPGERERFEMVARAAELLEEAGLADLSHAVRQQLERMHRRGDGERREGREHQERERAEGRPVTLGHLREMREFIGKLHERVEDLSNRVEELEGVLEEAEEREREGGEEPEGDSP